jgi:glycosyltransferase involved in cell wall biosynthesis
MFMQWKPNIIHKTYFNSYEYKYTKAKKIVNVWDLSHEIFHKMYKKNKDWRPKKKALEKIDHVICSSKNTQKQLIKYYNFDFKKTSVVYQCAPNLKTTLSIQDKKEKILLYVGSRLKYKNFENLLKAFSLNKNVLEDFKLICLGEESISNREMFLIEDLKLNKKNIIFENVDDFKLAKYYSNATALLYPSKNEGFGFPPLEAMSYGCPVISSNNKAILEATNLIEYSFDPNDPKDIINKIENIIYSQEKINFLNNYGLDRVKIFNKNEMVQNIKNIYDRLI